MSTLHALYNRLTKIKVSLPPPQPGKRTRDASLLTEQEQEQLSAFFDSLPRPLDIKSLSDEQRDERRHWLELEDALYRGDTAEAEKLRRRYGVTLEQLIDTFVNLDLSSLPTNCNDPGPSIQERHIIYHFTRTWHRYICMGIECGRARSYRHDMWRWIEYINARETMRT